jgi:type IV secretion system protein VirB9
MRALTDRAAAALVVLLLAGLNSQPSFATAASHAPNTQAPAAPAKPPAGQPAKPKSGPPTAPPAKALTPITSGAAAVRDARVQTLATDGDAVIDIAVQRGMLTHVVLPAGETFTLPPATGQGARCDDESHQWCVVAQGRDVFIKAKPGARTNNLILVTAQRRYAFELRAVDRGGLMRLTLKAPQTSSTSLHLDAGSMPMPRLAGSGAPGWPLSAASAVAADAAHAADPQTLLQQRLDQHLSAAPLPRNAQYSIALGKGAEDIAPSMVFDDGRFTYLKFPGNRPLPAVFETAPDGSEQSVNVRMGEDDFLVADRVMRRMVLRLGQTAAVIVNDGFDLEGAAARGGTTVPGVQRQLSQEPADAVKARTRTAPPRTPAPSAFPGTSPGSSPDPSSAQGRSAATSPARALSRPSPSSASSPSMPTSTAPQPGRDVAHAAATVAEAGVRPPQPLAQPRQAFGDASQESP